MTDSDLNRMFKHVAEAKPTAMPGKLEDVIMARVRVDEGRAKRWRSFVQWLLVLASISGIVIASSVGWAMASRDTTHSTPPTMQLFRTGGTQ